MRPSSSPADDLRGAVDADLVALGLGGTNMMAMLWTVAMGRRAVGVEMRGDPHLGVHWNVREDFFHQLGLIDRMMLDRYGEEGIPRRLNGKLFRLAEVFYSPATEAGDIVADEVIDGYDDEQHISGTIRHVEFIDDRWKDGMPNRLVTLLQPPAPPAEPDPTKIRTDMVAVLDGPSTFQGGASDLLLLLRRYLEAVEALDLETGRDPPRVRLFTRHRSVTEDGDGLVPQKDGRVRVRIEALHEFDYKGKFVRVRRPGTEPLDLGVPELLMVAEGFRSTDAERLGFRQKDVKVDHHDGRGPVVAQADFLAGLVEILVDGRLRRRIASEFDDDGNEYWVRQIAVGHENDPEVGWVLVQVPDFKSFDPVEAGLVPPGTDPKSPEYFATFQYMVYDFYMEQCALVLELPKQQLMKVQTAYGPKLFSLVERAGDEARIAVNAVVGGDGFGNGHFLTSGGAMTGMVGHGRRVLEYWRARADGATPEAAIRELADGIKEDTHAWLHVSVKEYTDAVPINFGAERIEQIQAAGGVDPKARATTIDANRRRRHSLLPLDPGDWRRIFLRNGKVHSAPLPELHAMHPSLRAQRSATKGAKVSVAYVAPLLLPDTVRFLRAVLGQPGARVAVISQDRPDALPESMRLRLAGFARVADALDPAQISDAVHKLARDLGAPDLLIGTADELQLTLAEVRDALGIPGMGPDTARNFYDKPRMRALLQHAGLPLAGPDTTGRACSLDVVSIGGLPAWSSAVRSSNLWTVTLPREPDDPADGVVRRMGFAALRALGVGTGMSHIRWFRLDDGSAAIADVAARPPSAHIVSLMGYAHDADIFRAWANATIHEQFAPIPRPYAAGAAFLPVDGKGRHVAAVHGLDAMLREMSELVVETRIPEVGARSAARHGAEGHVLVRHAETAVVEQALAWLTATLRVELGSEPKPTKPRQKPSVAAG